VHLRIVGGRTRVAGATNIRPTRPPETAGPAWVPGGSCGVRSRSGTTPLAAPGP